ncbi:sigma-70 family RNA polymerase sigma factor [Enterococcus bulliens]
MYERTLEQEILQHLPLIHQVIYRMSINNSEYEYDDLFNIGVIGLMDAVKRYDKSKNVPFEVYARLRIKGTIIDEVRKHAKISRYKVSALNQFYEARRTLEQRYKRNVSDQEVADFLHLTPQKLSELYESMHYLSQISLEDTLLQHPLPERYIYESNATIDATEQLIKSEQETQLTSVIKQLSKRDQLILSLYYEQELTLKEIAEVLDLSTPRISQLHGKILVELRQKLSEDMT